MLGFGLMVKQVKQFEDVLVSRKIGKMYFLHHFLTFSQPKKAPDRLINNEMQPQCCSFSDNNDIIFIYTALLNRITKCFMKKKMHKIIETVQTRETNSGREDK